MDRKNRNKIIIKYNIAGIIMNLLLSTSKIIVGLVFKSNAISLDGINSLTDLISSALSIGCTLVGSKNPPGPIRLATGVWNTFLL